MEQKPKRNTSIDQKIQLFSNAEQWKKRQVEVQISDGERKRRLLNPKGEPPNQAGSGGNFAKKCRTDVSTAADWIIEITT